MSAATSSVRCAVYTRKSSEEGLEQDFNSLHAQRDACEAYVRSQRGEGWSLLKAAYDDGGISGGTMERPGLQRLLADIGAGKIDVVVVYKVDRLTRSLMDFAKMVEVFDRHAVSFVSVTQSFNTTTSMGRLTLNVLLSFAQFEREVTGERIRDKIAASKKKGLWMGGSPPLGYDVDGRTLKVNEPEAERVRHIFQRYITLKSVHLLQVELERDGICSKARTTGSGRRMGGCVINRGALFYLLSNPIYLGEIRHKAETYPGLHTPIVDRAVFEVAQRIMASNRRRHGDVLGKPAPSPLTSRLFDSDGHLMGPTSATGKGGARYRYYVTLPNRLPATGSGTRPFRIAAAPLEAFLAQAVSRWVGADSILPWEKILPAMRRVAILGADLVVKLEIPRQADAEIAPSRMLVAVQRRLVDGERATINDQGELAITAPCPISVRSKAGEVILPAGTYLQSRPRPNRALISALRRAYKILSAANASPLQPPSNFNQAIGIDDPYQRRLARLAFLAPAIQRAILEGRQPPSLTLQQLLDLELPASWEDQLELLSLPRRAPATL